MSFMKPQITTHQRWIEVDTSEGTYIIPYDDVTQNKKKHMVSISDVNDFLPPSVEVFEINIIDGYGARLSASGYMDCTEWTVHNTKKEAAQQLLTMYYDMDEPESEETEWLNSIIRDE